MDGRYSTNYYAGVRNFCILDTSTFQNAGSWSVTDRVDLSEFTLAVPTPLFGSFAADIIASRAPKTMEKC